MKTLQSLFSQLGLCCLIFFSSNSSTLYAQATPDDQMVLVVPAYKYPLDNFNDTDLNTFWTRLKTAANSLGERLVVIVDPASGPGTGCVTPGFIEVPSLPHSCDNCPNVTDVPLCKQRYTVYTQAINEMRTSGATVIGYKSLNNTVQGNLGMINELYRWYYWYHIDGIFYDEGDYDGVVGDIRGLYWTPYNIVNGAINLDQVPVGLPSRGEGNQLTIVNMGRIRSDLNAAWVGTPASGTSWNPHQSLICPFENTSAVFDSSSSQISALQNKDRCLILVHTTPTADWQRHYQTLRGQGFKYFYITDDNNSSGNPYDALPSYFQAIVNQID